jgi:putative Ca2+/H+ antiporter (TMEM165/GDT1 family)
MLGVMIAALLVSFALVFVAELGDKTQVLVAWLATRYRPWQVMAGVLLGSMAIHGLAVVAGATLGAFVPAVAVEITAGVLFLGFAILALKGASDGAGEGRLGTLDKRPVLGTAGAFFIAELGDKTQLMVLARAAQESADSNATVAVAAAVWLGAVLAMVAADGLAVLAGSLLGARVRQRILALLSAALFAGFGIFTLGRVLITRL